MKSLTYLFTSTRVMTAAKGLIGTFREHNPTMLHKRDRGRPGDDSGVQSIEYGQTSVGEYVDGVDLLTMHEERLEAEVCF